MTFWTAAAGIQEDDGPVNEDPASLALAAVVEDYS